MRVIEIEQSPHYEGKKFFLYNHLDFDEGVTVLVGCNGSGKSTIIGNIKRYCKKNNIDCVQFDNLQDGASQLFRRGRNQNSFRRICQIIETGC